MALFVFLLFSILYSSKFSHSICLSSIKKLPLPEGTASPMSISFSGSVYDPYISCSDGRILKYRWYYGRFDGFGYTSPNRNATFCDNTNIVDRMPACGVPSGLVFSNLGQLFVTDFFYGLTSIELFGGPAMIRMGVPPLHLSNVVDVDLFGIVRFTDASTVATPLDLITGVGFPEGDNTGSLYEFDPTTEKHTLLIDQKLSAPTGLATDPPGTYVLITSESEAKTVSKYWLRGEKAGTLEVIKNLTGFPRNIKINEYYDFWVAENIINSDSSVTPRGVKINGDGTELATVDFSQDYDKKINIVIEHHGKLYVGGLNFTFVGVYDILPNCQ